MIWETRIGDLTVYAIEDGWSLREPTVFFPTSDQAVWDANPQYLHDGLIKVPFGCFLIRSADDLTLIDTGLGIPQEIPAGWGAGQLLPALASLDIAPGDITTIVHTHLHPDHLGGNLTDGRLTFPEAEVWTHTRELAYWKDAEHQAGDHIRNVISTMQDAGVVRTVSDDQQIADGITMVETFGHTPGHVAVLIASSGQRGYVTGDVTHHPIQAVHSDWNVAFDVDKDAAAATRERVYSQLADSGVVLAAGHFPRPGFGKIVTDEGYRVFTPVPTTHLA